MWNFERMTRRYFTMLIVMASLCGGGCSKASSDGAPSTDHKRSAVPSTVPLPVASEAEGEAGAVYRAMWQDLTVASATSDATSPLLDDHARGDALELMRYGLKKAKKERVVTKGEPHVAPKVVKATRQEAQLEDCVDGTDWLQYELNGELKNDVPGSHRKADAIVRREGGVWKVSSFHVYEAGSC
ncbi:hypothetical protein ACH4TX_19085 [Streptomyces sp. NPDC021098]|uniref:hypothetical protein n=1 Tax=unclassified Streptomyces TaxID=2593676 RepID=UPI00379ED5E5